MANFNDRVLTPEMMRALALLYAGPSPVPFDLQSDYHLSPILTPEALLDPLVDDTIIFAGRLRDAKQRAWRRDSGKPRPRDQDVAEVTILEGVSHAVLQIMMRVSWEKQKHPYIQKLARSMMPRITWRSKRIQIQRLASAYGYDPADPKTTVMDVFLYYAGKVENLPRVTQVILHVHGGGFVCMDPECHEDYLTQWAHMAPGCLVVALNYGKAPEYPFPYGLEENFEFYRLIRETNGECLGLGGWFYDVTALDDQGNTALHFAAALARAPILKLLIARGGDVCCTNALGETPLMCAVSGPNGFDTRMFAQVMALLGVASLAHVDHAGRTVLHHLALAATSARQMEPAAMHYLECLFQFVASAQDAEDRSALAALVEHRDVQGEAAHEVAERLGAKALVQALRSLAARGDVVSIAACSAQVALGPVSTPATKSIENQVRA
ncbi:hypothetical protein AMAG_17778 [Allomyces macrogynus ATCC 38327]|uniref:Alpha/beta hydrolase fold-3 domain-containing protein n=1 Tax=Allomyces macrogynus (strain ATCC 38327) TaxID=578462 RepID=A0A0L0RYJ8_ALLM3|nr:hypothetical protein AMAG_17778 [Allomyces macrogynus ATCC 38327]|eukprot:KNE55423.1 hypothetical protein AMAG_17778 [Allomyces macrogynus ATCC 38327]